MTREIAKERKILGQGCKTKVAGRVSTSEVGGKVNHIFIWRYPDSKGNIRRKCKTCHAYSTPLVSFSHCSHMLCQRTIGEAHQNFKDQAKSESKTKAPNKGASRIKEELQRPNNEEMTQSAISHEQSKSN